MPTDTLTRVTADAVEFFFVCLILMLFVCGLALLDSEQPGLGAVIVAGIAALIGRLASGTEIGVG
jgi:hypothetical protein